MSDHTHEQAPSISPQAKLDNFSKYLIDQPPEDPKTFCEPERDEADVGFDADADDHAERQGHAEEAAGADAEAVERAVADHAARRESEARS